MLTLRQIEVIRAIMLAGTVKGAADLLAVSAPGISRVMKHTEGQLGIRLFSRAHGRFVPTTEAQGIFAQINDVFARVGNLHYAISALKRGANSVFSFASVPSIAQHILPPAVKRLRLSFPELQMNINILKIEEAIDYLLLGKGELVAMSFRLDHPGLVSLPLATGRLVALLPAGHALAAAPEVALADLAREPLIGIDPADPYGRILAAPFAEAGLGYDLTIQARFGQTIEALVAQGLGVAVIDEFSVAGPLPAGLVVRPLAHPTSFRTFVVTSAETARSIFADRLIELLRAEMRAVRQR